MNDFPWLTVLMVVPLVGAVVTAALPYEGDKSQPKKIALGFSLLTLVLAAVMATQYDADRPGGGFQLTGSRWRRAADRVGVGLVRHGLSADHRDYLAAGGAGFLLGDGRLRYGPEEIAEVYYRAQLGPYLEASPDVQRVVNPGYNRDRGPATVFGVRLNVRY